MEAIGGVASIIAVVTLALQSTKVIYEAASSVNHGSDDIDRLAKATSNLEELLEVIKRLAEHAENTKSVADGKLLEELTPLIDQCANALSNIAPKLDQMKIDDKDRPWKKVKKHAKVYLDTKRIAEIWNVVNHYVQLLGSRLTNASVDIGLYNAENFSILRNELSIDSRSTRSDIARVEDILRDQRTLIQAHWDALQAESHQRSLDAQKAAATQIQGITELKTGQRQLKEAITVEKGGIARLRADVQVMSAAVSDQGHEATARSETFMTQAREVIAEATNISSVRNREIELMNAEVLQKLHGISDRLETFPSIASEQLSTLQSLLEMISGLQLGRRTGGQEQRTSTMSEPYRTEIGRSDNSGTSNDAKLEAILAKTCHFASRMKATRYSREAQSVIEDIGWLLGVVMRQISATMPNPVDLPRKRKTLSNYDYSELETAAKLVENLGKAKRVLTASQQVQILHQDLRRIDQGINLGQIFPDETNGLIQTFRPRRAPSTNLQSMAKSWNMRCGRLDAFFKTTLFPDTEELDTESADEAFAAKILVTPTQASASNLQIAIDTVSRTYRNRTIYFTPTLTFRAMVADDSEVFRVVEGGSVKKLRMILSSGKASLGDCDSMGRSLLNFALHFCRRKMTNFLIESGADVDSLEPTFDIIQIVKPLEMIFTRYDQAWADGDRKRGEYCYKLLLDAGTDISSVVDFNHTDCGESAYSRALQYGTLAKVKALLDLGGRFISVDFTGDQSPYETIPLQLLANDHYIGWRLSLQIFDKMALLLSRGADVKARNSRGKTCLHTVLSGHFHKDDECWCQDESRRSRHLCRTKDIIILMITAGADVCAVDEEGCSESDVAIRSGLQTLWTEALKYCGIDIKDVLARSDFDRAYSTALNSEYRQSPRFVRSKVSMTEYLERRTEIPDEESDLSDLADASEDDDDDENEDWSPFEDEEREDEDVAKETSMTTKATEQEAVGGDEESHIEYKEFIARKKAKLE